VWTTATLVPWEQERQERIIRALCQGRVGGTKPSLPGGEGRFAHLALKNGLPPSTGPGAALSAGKWGELLYQTRLADPCHPYDWSLQREQVYLRGPILVTALAMYQAKHGKPAEKLEGLVPAYLSTLPLDPYTGQPFHYRISRGEKIEWGSPDGITVVDGQGLVWSDGNRSFQPAEGKPSDPAYLFLVPVWKDR
jgi:hypothetical protein